MDYEKLIKLLRDENNCDVLDYVEDAADAIEVLLAERDAALERSCADCKHFVISHNGCTPDCDCNNSECKCVDGVNLGWQWRGPKEHKNDK